MQTVEIKYTWINTQISSITVSGSMVCPVSCVAFSLMATRMGRSERVVTLNLSNEALTVHGVTMLTQATPAVRGP